MFKKSIFILFFVAGLILAQQNPKITVKPLHYDLGNIKQGKIVTKIYRVKNEGSGKLIIKDVNATCGCTAVKPMKNELKPGESTELKVTFNSTGRIGKQEKTVYIISNDPVNSTLPITFSANVLAEKEVSKTPKLSFTERSHDFGRLSEGKIAQYSFDFVNSGGSTLEIGYIVSSGTLISAHVSNRRIEPGAKGSLKVELDTSNMQGKVTQNVKVGCNDPSEPTQILSITADVIKKN
ncbi:MAG: DUF1573 domain-containing protein [Bacteroidota bacterium]|nr:DUF1573 domain-containing protein [Bacteroidota bacterium]